jgi:hypothetical protein
LPEADLAAFDARLVHDVEAAWARETDRLKQHPTLIVEVLSDSTVVL